MVYRAPKKVTWIVALVLFVIALLGMLFTIPGISDLDLAPWLAIIGLALLLVATVVEGL